MSKPKFRRRSKKSPYDPAAQYQVSLQLLLTQDGRRRTRGVRQESGTRVVVRTSDNSWSVRGGACEHNVIMQDGRLFCSDHEQGVESHPPRIEGRLCCHEYAVYSILAWDRIPELFTEDGLRKVA